MREKSQPSATFFSLIRHRQTESFWQKYEAEIHTRICAVRILKRIIPLPGLRMFPFNPVLAFPNSINSDLTGATVGKKCCNFNICNKIIILFIFFVTRFFEWKIGINILVKTDRASFHDRILMVDFEKYDVSHFLTALFGYLGKFYANNLHFQFHTLRASLSLSFSPSLGLSYSVWYVRRTDPTCRPITILPEGMKRVSCQAAWPELSVQGAPARDQHKLALQFLALEVDLSRGIPHQSDPSFRHKHIEDIRVG